MQEIYLAGGCFWGTEQLFHNLKGIIKTEVGYANGDKEEHATYKYICNHETGFQETVKITYDENLISLSFILLAFFYVIHPEEKNRQGNDVGSQYQSGIYYLDLDLLKEIKPIYELEKSHYKNFQVQLGPLKNFYKAEEYHQAYLVKNPTGYCHISLKEMSDIKMLEGKMFTYNKNAKEKVKELLNGN